MRTALGMLLLAVGGAFAVVVSTAAPASACSCVMGGQRDHLERADVVFTGEMIAREATDQRARYRFAVDRVFEGDAPATVEVNSAAYGAACGLEGIEPGIAYVVYATEDDGGALGAGLCGGTRKAAAPYVDRLEQLAGTGRAPADAGATVTGPASADTETTRASTGLTDRGATLALVSGAAAVVIAGGLLLGRRRIRE